MAELEQLKHERDDLKELQHRHSLDPMLEYAPGAHPPLMRKRPEQFKQLPCIACGAAVKVARVLCAAATMAKCA